MDTFEQPPTGEPELVDRESMGFARLLADFAVDLATVDDLGRLCSFVGQRASRLVGANEAKIYLDTRPLPGEDSPFQFALPLRVGGKEVGTLVVVRYPPEGERVEQEQGFSEQERRRLLLFSKVAAVAIANVKQEQIAQQRASWRDRTLKLLQDTSYAMGSTLELVPLMRRIIHVTVRALDAEAGILALLNDSGELLLRAAAGTISRDEIGSALDTEQGLLGWVLQHRRALLIPNLGTDQRASSDYMVARMQSQVHTLLAVPLVTKGRAIGAIEVANRRDGSFDEADQHILEALALSAATAIENARLYERMQRQTLQQENIIRVGQAMSSAQDVNAVLQQVVDAILSVIPNACTSTVHLLDQEDKTLQVHCYAGRPLWSPREQPFKIGQGVAGHVFATHQVINVADVLTERRYLPGPGRVGYRSLLVAPLIVEDKPLGTLSVTGVEPGVFSREDEGMIRGLATQAAVALRNARLLDSLRESVAAQIEAKQAIARQADQLAALNTISSSISRSLDIDTIVRGGIEELLSILDLDAAGLILLDPERDRLVPETVVGLSTEFLEFVVPLQNPERSQAFQTRQPVIIPDVLEEPRFARYPGLREVIEREGVRTLGAVPVVAQDEVIGVLFVAAYRVDALSSSDVDLLVTVGQQFGVALYNAHLYAEAEERAEQLEVAYRQLQDLARRKSQFVQNTSHELRTPLTFVRGYVELLLGGDFGPIPSRQQEAITIIDEKSRRLLNLINDIACLMDVELGPDDIQAVDLVELMVRVLVEQRQMANRVGVVFETEWPDELVVIRGSRYRLKKVFFHLVDNAIKFSPNGGQVRVKVWSEGEGAFVQISDQGIGISPEEQQHIFDSFYQVDGSTTRRFEGTGLGLAIVKETVEAHGGTVRVDSSGVDGEGATFTLLIPLAKEGDE